MPYKVIAKGMFTMCENETGEKLINAREIRLGSKKEFANWIKNRIKKYEFIENIDFLSMII